MSIFVFQIEIFSIEDLFSCLQNFEKGKRLRSYHIANKTDLFFRPPSAPIAAKEAVQIIENAWCRHRDKQMFRLLKHAVCAAEHGLSDDILRRIAPREAELLRDPSMSVKVKFR